VTATTYLPRVPTQRPPVARQPIWTTTGTLLGHEYLYRSRVGRPAGVDLWRAERQDVASASVLRSIFEESSRAVGSETLIFVNVTRSFLVRDRPLPAHLGRLVLEIVESVPGDEGVVLGLRRLRARGYRIAIDDFRATADQLAMLPHADYVKIDCRDLLAQGESLLTTARSCGAQVVAERVETPELVAHCVRLGFDLLQGDALGPAVTLPL
jgi:EAL and modified HD-GYP domain-containing signal transduction protein